MILRKGREGLVKNGDFFKSHQFCPHFMPKIQKWPYLGNGLTDFNFFLDIGPSTHFGSMTKIWTQNSDLYGSSSIESLE